METQLDDPPIPLTLIECGFHQLTLELCDSLPPARTDQQRTDRKKAAIAQVVALQPASTLEFELAAHVVLAFQRSKHYLARSDEPDLPPSLALQWASKANNMMRQANSHLRSLLRLQAGRRTTEADHKAFDRGERIENHLTILMTQAAFGSPVSDDPHPHAPLPLAAPPDEPAEDTVSSHDPESHPKKSETPIRQPERWRVARPGYDIPYPGGAPEDLYLPPRYAEG